MLDEESLRRPDFVDGEPVVLADGQTWYLRRPVVRFAPAENEAGFQVCLSLAGDDGFGALTEAYERVSEGTDLVRAELALGRAVLLANYDLTPAQFGLLLRFGYSEDDPEGSRLRDDVMAVATGRGKGRSDAGGG